MLHDPFYSLDSSCKIDHPYKTSSTILIVLLLQLSWWPHIYIDSSSDRDSSECCVPSLYWLSRIQPSSFLSSSCLLEDSIVIATFCLLPINGTLSNVVRKTYNNRSNTINPIDGPNVNNPRNKANRIASHWNHCHATRKVTSIANTLYSMKDGSLYDSDEKEVVRGS